MALAINVWREQSDDWWIVSLDDEDDSGNADTAETLDAGHDEQKARALGEHLRGILADAPTWPRHDHAAVLLVMRRETRAYFERRAAAVALGRKGGSAKSERKTAAVTANGRTGNELRWALKRLRERIATSTEYPGVAGACEELSDGTRLVIEHEPASDGGILLGAFRIVRYDARLNPVGTYPGR